MTNDIGRAPSGQALVNEAATHLHPSGFDPSRCAHGILQPWQCDDCDADAWRALTAAAPDLYEALEGLLATHKQGRGQCCEAADKAIDALAKARGEA